MNVKGSLRPLDNEGHPSTFLPIQSLVVLESILNFIDYSNKSRQLLSCGERFFIQALPGGWAESKRYAYRLPSSQVSTQTSSPPVEIETSLVEKKSARCYDTICKVIFFKINTFYISAFCS